MKEKSKNIVKALIIAVIVTGILATLSYYTILKPLGENVTPRSTLSPLVDSEEQFYQNALAQIIVFLIAVFCMSTVLSYIVIERLNKRKK